jgi:hypothetical protein
MVSSQKERVGGSERRCLNGYIPKYNHCREEIIGWEEKEKSKEEKRREKSKRNAKGIQHEFHLFN